MIWIFFMALLLTINLAVAKRFWLIPSGSRWVHGCILVLHGFFGTGIIMHRSRWQTGVTGHMSNGAHIWHLFVKCLKIKHLDYGGVSQKKINGHNEVYTYWCQFWSHIWWSVKTLKLSIKIIFGQFCWPSYLTSKLMSISVNLIMSIYFFCEPPP